MSSLLDLFFGDSDPKKYKSGAANEFFAGRDGARKERAKESLKSFDKLPERVRQAIFDRAKIEPKKLYELTPAQRVRLLCAAEKIRDEIGEKLAYANTAAASIFVLVDFKGDRR